MPWELETLQSEKVVCLKASGSMGLELIKQMCTEAIAAANQHGFIKCLVDFRDMIPELSTVNIYDLPGFPEGIGDDRRSKKAMVVSPDSGKREDFKFFETVSVNQGFKVQLFTDIEEARKWIG